ncbi:MAG: cation transporter [Patescibacteria group bacterium]
MVVAKKIFKIDGMDCVSCAVMIDDVLEEVPGVLSSKTSYAKGETEVEFDEGKTTEEDVAASIEQGGYSVESNQFR